MLSTHRSKSARPSSSHNSGSTIQHPIRGATRLHTSQTTPTRHPHTCCHTSIHHVRRLHNHAAVDVVHLPGDVGGGGVQRQEAHQAGHLLRLAIAGCGAEKKFQRLRLRWWLQQGATRTASSDTVEQQPRRARSRQYLKEPVLLGVCHIMPPPLPAQLVRAPPQPP